MRNGSTRLGTLGIRTHQLIGAGGFCTGISIANDGTKQVRTDTFNSYSLEVGSDTWHRDLIPGLNCNASDINLFYGTTNPWGQCGTYDAAIAPSNSQVRYTVCMGKVWVTQNGGTLWAPTALAQKAGCQPNESNRMSGRPLAVDPANPDVVVFFAPDGLHISTDRGANWTSVSTATVPAPASGKRGIVAFGPASTVSGGRTQTIYVFSNDTGLYRTTNAATSWAAVSGSPTNASHMKVGSNGYVYLGGDGASGIGQFRRWDPAGPTWIAPTDIECKDIAVSPHNAGHVYRNYAGGGLDVSLDYGATWALGSLNSADTVRQATNIEWQEWTNEQYMTNGGMEFDPIDNRIWVASGTGVWYLDAPPTTLSFGQDVNWVEYAKGIENMVSSIGTFNESGVLGYSMHDRGVMIIPPAQIGNTFPARHGLSTAFQHSQQCDYAPEDNAFWVASSMQGSGTAVDVTGYTENSGATWTPCTDLTAAATASGGGQIVALSKDVWIQAPVGAAKGLWLWSGRGATVTEFTIGDGVGMLVQQAYNYSRRVLVKDRFTEGRAYLYHVGNPDSGGSGAGNLSVNTRGCWRIDVNLTTLAITKTRVFSTYISAQGGYGGADFYHGKLTQGASADEWYWCGADESLGLWRSTDGMASWAQVTGSDDVNGASSFGEVFGFGVGKAAAGSAYPTLLAAGYRQVTPASATDATGYGFWISFDNGATWTRVAQFLDGMFDIVNDIAGCPVTFGRFAILWGGSGASLFDYQYTARLS